ncbi:MAG: hypothetical protein ACJAWL_001737 [Motiliproteus sp.]|jgi:hypothetical protein
MNKKLSILSKVSRNDVILDPYPHIIIKNALPQDIYETLYDALPSPEIVLDGREKKDTWFDYPACKVTRDERISSQWRSFFEYHTSEDFFKELIEIFGESIKKTHPSIEKRLGKRLEDSIVKMRPGGRYDRLADGADISMECQFYVNYTRTSRSVRKSHVDRPSELFAALLYLRDDEDSSTGGDLLIKESTNPSLLYPTPRSISIDELPMEIDGTKVNTIDRVKYESNTLVLFINSPQSIHEVSERSETELPRRHINFCCDVPFDLFNIKHNWRNKLKLKADTTPFIWRLKKYI